MTTSHTVRSALELTLRLLLQSARLVTPSGWCPLPTGPNAFRKWTTALTATMHRTALLSWAQTKTDQSSFTNALTALRTTSGWTAPQLSLASAHTVASSSTTATHATIRNLTACSASPVTCGLPTAGHVTSPLRTVWTGSASTTGGATSGHAHIARSAGTPMVMESARNARLLTVTIARTRLLALTAGVS